jgi:hypothetical protein
LLAWLIIASPAYAGSGVVTDNNTDVAAVNAPSPTTYEVYNDGLDSNIVAVAKDSSGDIVAWINVGHGETKQITVPKGGSLEVDDRDFSGSQTSPTIADDSNSDGARYEFNKV